MKLLWLVLFFLFLVTFTVLFCTILLSFLLTVSSPGETAYLYPDIVVYLLLALANLTCAFLFLFLYRRA